MDPKVRIGNGLGEIAHDFELKPAKLDLGLLEEVVSTDATPPGSLEECGSADPLPPDVQPPALG